MSHLPNLSALPLALGVSPEGPALYPAAKRLLLEQADAPLELLDLPDDLIFYILSFTRGMSCDQIRRNCETHGAFAAVCAQDVFWRWQSEKASYDRPDRLNLVDGQRMPKGGSWRRHYQWWCERKHTNQTLRTAVEALRPQGTVAFMPPPPWNYNHSFYGPISQWDVSDVTDMSWLFHKLDGESRFWGDISRWDVSNVQVFKSMFYNQDGFNINLSWWDVSSALDMAGMFARCSAFDQSLASWGPKVSKVKDMHEMFYDCHATTLGLSNWNVSSVENMDYMFALSAIQDDLSQWDVSNVTSMKSMFFNALFQGDISMWEVGRVRTMNAMFESNQGFNNDLSAWASKLGQVRDMNSMFSDTTSFTGTGLSQWDVSKVRSMSNMFADAVNFNEDLSMWYIGNSYTMTGFLDGATQYQPPPGHHVGMRAGPPAGPWPDETDDDGNVIHTGAEVMNAFFNAYLVFKNHPNSFREMLDMVTDEGFHQILPNEPSTGVNPDLKPSRRFVHQHLCRRAMLPGPGSSLPNGAQYLAGMKNPDGSPKFETRYDRYVRDRMFYLQEMLVFFQHVNGGNLRDATRRQWLAAVQARVP